MPEFQYFNWQFKQSFDHMEIEWKRYIPWSSFIQRWNKYKKIVHWKFDNPYFLSSICVISEYPGLISNKFSSKDTKSEGFYFIKLFIDSLNHSHSIVHYLSFDFICHWVINLIVHNIRVNLTIHLVHSHFDCSLY